MTDRTVVRFEPRGAVLELFKDRSSSEVMLSGPAGTGKTVGALMKIHLVCLQTPRVRALLLRKTAVSLSASTLVTFRQKVAQEAIDSGLVKFYGGSAQEPASFRYTNGSVVVVGGLDRSTRLLSTEYDLIFVDEAIEVTAEDIDTLTGRARNGRISFQQIIMCTNPGPPSHHLKQRADAGRTRMLYSVHEDNPRMHHGGEWTEYGRSYLARLDSLTGVRYERMRWGRWVAAEGLIYENFDPNVHVLDALEIPDEWPRWWCVDFGYTNPFVLQCWAEDPDGRLYLYREIYRTQRLVEDHAKDILRIVAPRGEWREPRPRAIICDHDAEDRATLERHLGMGTIAARKSVSDGIQAVQSRLRPAGDGRPRLFFLRGALAYRDPLLADAKRPGSALEEITGYVWDSTEGKPPKETPVKKDDHSCDAMRYMVADRDLGAAPRLRRL